MDEPGIPSPFGIPRAVQLSPAEEHDLATRLLQSDFWRYLDGVLELRLKGLLAEIITTSEAAMKNRGAIEEVQRMRTLPAQVLMQYRMEHPQERH